jgi:hypothetical protein
MNPDISLRCSQEPATAFIVSQINFICKRLFVNKGRKTINTKIYKLCIVSRQIDDILVTPASNVILYDHHWGK